ncbi:MAG: reverse transcriptase family protein [Planctomycetaceae bacterium]
MGLFDLLRRMVFGSPSTERPSNRANSETSAQSAGEGRSPSSANNEERSPRSGHSVPASPTVSEPSSRQQSAELPHSRSQSDRRSHATPDYDSPLVHLARLNYVSSLVPTPTTQEIVEGDQPPYRFAHRQPWTGRFLDFSTDIDVRWLEYYGVPHLQTPEQLANWLELPLGKLAWLTYRFCDNYRPQSAQEAHYHFRWIRKRTGGHRLIESPKKTLKQVQHRILREILDRIPSHPAAHGFVPGRSIITNAEPHCDRRFILKFDLENFYPSVRYSRVVSIFRSIGYSREVAIWLARLTTSSAPSSLKLPLGESTSIWKYMPRHLPQGAPTSPALANLSAFALDVRLSGLAHAYHLRYTRYADDLTFSGEGRAVPALREIILLTQQIIRDERFMVHRQKRKLIRSSQRQVVTGVVVNEGTNISRSDYDRLKATLHNCLKHGPASQNHQQHPEFAAQLRGRIAHVSMLNEQRGKKLLEMFAKIRWT